MFCYKCGFHLSDEALFCSQCGLALNTIPVQLERSKSPASKELDKEAIRVYLSDLLALEFAQKKLSADYYAINNEIECFEWSNYNLKYYYENKNCIWLRYDGNKYYLRLEQYKDGTYGIQHSEDDYGYWFSIDENWEWINDYHNWPTCDATILNLFFELLYDLFIDSSRRKSFRDFFLMKYDDFKEKAPSIHAENLSLKQSDYLKRDGIKKELDEASALLANAYSINIIPQQFRNLYAIWFIHDYLTTSNETLSNAFLQFNLDEIKNKLDIVIEQQQEIILNQRIQIAQNEQILEQNQNMLNKLTQIEHNSEQAAKYSQIAANNAEACAWIGVANYIR